MRVAITGATGFIGRRLAEAHLARGDRVRLLTRRPSDQRIGFSADACWVHGDLSDPGAPLAAFVDGCDILYHCAGELRDVTRMTDLHVHGTRRLIDAAASRIGRWVQLSSVGVYGPQRGGIVTEETALRPVNHYEKTKAEADALVQNAHMARRVVATIVRPSIVFGPDMPGSSLRQWIGMVRRGAFFFIGPPGATANYVPIESTVEALMLCGIHSSAAGGTFNVSEHASVEQFVGWMADECHVRRPWIRLPLRPVRAAAGLLGRLPRSPLTLSRVDALTSRVRYPQTKLERELGFHASTSIEDALRATVRGCLENSA